MLFRSRELWGRYWVFAHNGDLKEFSPVLNGAFRPVGHTDSERAFCYLLQQLRARFGDEAPSMADLGEALRALTTEIASHGVFNMMLSDGSALFAHCSTRLHYIIRQYPFTQAQLSDEDLTVDFSEVTTPNDRVAIIVTEPLTTNETWTSFSPGEMRIFVDGAPLS